MCVKSIFDHWKVTSGYLLFQSTSISIKHTAAKTTPQMQKKIVNPKAIHDTTRMTVAGGFGTPSASKTIKFIMHTV